MKKQIFALVAVLGLLTFPLLAMAQGWEMGMHPRMGYGPSGMGRWASSLNLNNEQVQKLEALHEKFLKETIALRNDLELKQVELRTLWLPTNPEEGRKVLTPEQQLKATTFFMRGDFALHRGLGWREGFCPMG